MNDLNTKMMPVKEHADVIAQSMILSHLFGRLTTNDQMGAAIAEGQKTKDKGQKFAEADEIPTAFEKALEFMLAKNIITSAEFAKLEKNVRKYAFSVAKVDSERLLELLRDNLADALESGALNVEQWLGQLGSVFDAAGVTKLNDYHLRTVFRTNMQTALNEGRFKMIQEADDEEFPLIEFVAILDNRTRDSHAKLDGFRAPKNDPIWQQITPPLDYNCRCTLRPVHVDEGLEASKTMPDLTGIGFN